MTQKVIGALVLLVIMAIHVVIFVPPLWFIPVATGCGILYYTLRMIISLRRPEQAVEFGFEAMMATVLAYALLVALEVVG
jgi:hypothetical protein